MKKIILCLFATVMAFSMATFPVNAQEGEDVLSYDDFEIVDDTTLKDDKDVYYYFETIDDRDEFLIALDLENYPNVYACLPGDPGYPHCNTNPVVNVTSKVIKTETTGYISCKDYLLHAWVYGGKGDGVTMSIGGAESLGFSFLGISKVISINYGASFPVPPKKYGNIKYKAKFKVTTHQQIYILKDGTRKNGTTYKTSKELEGAYYACYK